MTLAREAGVLFLLRKTYMWQRMLSLYFLPSQRMCFSLITPSLRADEIKLWLTPSAKQRQNPCPGLPAVYPDLSTHHDWPV